MSAYFRPNWHVVDQRTPEWFALKAGKFSGSTMATVLSHGRNDEESKTRRKLIVKLATERDTGKTVRDFFENQAMRDGTVRESPGRGLFEQLTGHMVDDSYGFIDHPSIPWFGVSPDGIILPADLSGYPVAGLEIKSPELHTFTDRVLTRSIPMAYTWQCQTLMECAALERVYYVNYQPDRPAGQQMLVHVIERNETMIRQLIDGVKLASEEVEELRYALARAKYF